ncbi:MAG: glucose-6-phosphate dehydrogenase [Planctomycetota bacterium]|nr:glucose-6-phosphate dehydrogenase [Planctomycetota bacterium]
MKDLSKTQIRTRIEPGNPQVKEESAPPCTVIIFGALGDLSKRKLIPALYNLYQEGDLPEHFAVLGLNRDQTDDHGFRESHKESTDRYSRTKPEKWDAFSNNLHYIPGDFTESDSYNKLRVKLEEVEAKHLTEGNRIFYLATPARFFPLILEQLQSANLLHEADGEPWSRVIIEKPFGTDLGSAKELNTLVGKRLSESQTYRIDHYLGKETVQNILVFRFGNTIFEPLWNRNHIDHVEITAAESIQVEGRGRFYDQTGVLRDIVQNHLLQVMALIAMEPPVSFEADDIRNEKVQLIHSLRPMEMGDVIRGQYQGYKNVEGVGDQSRTPTYVAMKIMVENWRWQGVPFYLRAGKGLAAKETEVSIHFRSIPLCLFNNDKESQSVQPNVLTLRIQPEEGISLRFVSKVPGDDLSVGNVHMDMSYAEAFQKPISEAYERLILDCMRGNQTLFARRDGVEKAWTFITPILDAWARDKNSPIAIYEPGSDGPKEADALLQRDGRAWTTIG